MTAFSPAAEEFGRRLRELRQASGRTQQQLAGQLGVQRATFSQWETGKHLPSAHNVTVLDEVLGGRSSLIAAADAARTPVVASTTGLSHDSSDTLSLDEIYRTVGRRLAEHLVLDETGRPQGWQRNFREDLPPTPFTTASAARAVVLLDPSPVVDRAALSRTLLSFHENGGWGTRRAGVRPEATAVVIDALVRLGADFDVDRHLGELEKQLNEGERAHVHVLVEALSTSARLRPDSELTRGLIRDLLAARDVTGRPGWPEKSRLAAHVIPRVSTAHTARAVSVLTHALDAGVSDPDGAVAEAAGGGVQWLTEHAQLDPSRENIEPHGDRDHEIRHFTPALLAHALASAASPPWALLQRALDEVWAYYSPAVGLWTWPNGDIPVWLQYDALAAIRLAAARTTRTPVARPVPS